MALPTPGPNDVWGADLNAEILARAKQVDVDAALAGKADVSAVALKADQSDLDDGLSLKADLSYVDNALAGKVDAVALDAKADTAYVDNAVAGKADASALTAVDTDLQQFKTLVPTSEDLVMTCPITRAAPTATGGAFPLAVLPYDATILSVNLAFDGAVTGDNANYWSAKFVRRTLDGSGSATLADRTTQLSAAVDPRANGGISAWVDWNFDAADWVDRNVNAGQLVYLNFAKAGTPDNLPAQFTATIRYQRRAA